MLFRSALPASVLAPVFPQFGSVNADAALAANARAHSLTNAAAPAPPPSIFTPARSPEHFQTLVIAVEQWLRTGGTNRTTLTMDEVGDAIRECIARGELERAKALFGPAGGRLKNSAELRYLGRAWEQAAAKP